MTRTGHLVGTATVLLLLTTACGGSADPSDGTAEYDSAPQSERAANEDSAQEAPAPADDDRRFEDYGVNADIPTAEQNQSTFALDVDTGSYAITRAALTDGALPDPASVRTEEFVNYFAQDYPAPVSGLGIHVDGAPVPWLADPAKHVVRVGLQGATVADLGRQQSNVTVVADVSGSMEGDKLQMVKAGLMRMVDSLRPDDRMAIVTYSTDAQLLLPMTPLTEADGIRETISGLRSQASTNLEAGLRIGYEHAKANLTPGAINRVVLLSDGVANVGQEDPDQLAAQIAQEAGDSTQLAVIGVGRETYDDVILEQFANQGNGFYAFMDTPAEAERLFVEDLTATLQSVALDAKVQVTFNPEVVSHFRLLGYENRHLDSDEFRDDTVDGGEIGAGHTVTALYQVTLHEGVEVGGDTPLVTVESRWTDPATDAPAEDSAVVTAASFAPSFELAPARLRQDVLVAAFAELLRGAPWAEHVGMGALAEHVGALSRSMPSDEKVAEFAALVKSANNAGG